MKFNYSAKPTPYTGKPRQKQPLKRTPIKQPGKRKPIAQRSNSTHAKEVRRGDAEFYQRALTQAKLKPYCEECNIYLPPQDMSRINISHILTKGAFPEHRNNDMNYNVLCIEHHTQWETGDRVTMRINEPNKIKSSLIIQQYNEASKAGK